MSPRLTRISLVQQGVIAQNEFAKLLMMGSRGLIELAAPLTDEERRDFEIHIHGSYGSAVAVQVKSVLELARLSKNVRGLHCQFRVRATRVVNDPLFWYFFACLDPRTMRFVDPTFLVPSHFVHQQASPVKSGGFWAFTVQASMELVSADRWAPYRVNTLDLGKKALAIMRQPRRVIPSSLAFFPPPLAGEGWGGGLVLLRKR
jgi:hypothetical protein